MKFLAIFMIQLILVFALVIGNSDCNDTNNDIKLEIKANTGNKARTMSRVEAVSDEVPSTEAKSFSYYSKIYFRKLFSFSLILSLFDVFVLSFLFIYFANTCARSFYIPYTIGARGMLLGIMDF